MKRLLFVLYVLTFMSYESSAQYHESRDHYIGNWENPQSWDPQWNSPEDSVLSTDIHINGFITINSSLYMAGTASDLWISDTLLVNGDLFLGNNGDLVIGDHGVLIVRGDLKVVNNTDILNRGYLIVTGDFINTSSNYGGSFMSTRNPSQVFICGSVSPVNNFFYPVLDCQHNTSASYSHTRCNYGDITDLSNDSIYDFFRSTCKFLALAGSNSPVCFGDTLKLSALDSSVEGSSFQWNGPMSFTSNTQNLLITANNLELSGKYILTVFTEFCTGTDTTDVVINELPSITAHTNSPVCEGESIQFSAAGGVFYDWQGPGSFTSNNQNPVIDPAGLPDAGYYRVRVTSADGCNDSLQLEVKINEYPVADAGSDQKLENVFEARLNALTVPTDSGEWSVISGSGIILDPSAPVSDVYELAPGINEFRWHVWNGKCESVDDVIITVNDLFIPNVITPNGDGKNDFFKIEGIEENAELTIMNRWGVVEFESTVYKNDWNGYGAQNRLLPDDTYFYILKLKNGLVCKGSLLIKRR